MIERFILPKRLPHTSQSRVCVSCGNSFECAHNPLERHKRFHKHVHVIRHDHPSMQTVPPKLGPANESLMDISGNLLVLQPPWAALPAIEALIENDKLFAGIIPLFLYSSQNRTGKRPKQSPSNKNTFRSRMPVRQVPFVVAHEVAKAFLPLHTFTFNILVRNCDRPHCRRIAPFDLRRVAATPSPKRRCRIAPSSTVIPGCAPLAKLH